MIVQKKVAYRIVQGEEVKAVYYVLFRAFDFIEKLDQTLPVMLEESRDYGLTWRLIGGRGGQRKMARAAAA